jgi:hypothetical protein
MSTAVLSRSNHSNASIGAAVAGIIAAWLALVFVLGAQEAFVSPPGTPPLPIFLGFAAPIALFLIAYRASARFRDFTLRFDVRLATGVQAWRFAGLGFIALYAQHVLPGAFAWPAGLGDIAIGLTAPLVALAITRTPAIAGSRGFVVWNLLGLLDLAVAVSIGTLVASNLIEVPAGAGTGIMAELPLLLIPVFLVPLFVILHLTALFQARRFAASFRATR